MKMKDSFVKTFIREDRYKMFINGILTTLLITVLSAIAGTLLGFAVFMCCRGGNRAANMITWICTGLIQGLPVVVILMILYYVVFASAPVTGAFVSVVAFTLTFASAVYSMVRTGVSAIDAGQTEAAYALGVRKNKTFFKIVLPQAMPYILPQYKGELVSLIKATAVVGYIAVEDLTRTGDLIRSRTYEAFFPLIAVAAIYFLMARILIIAVGRIEIRIDPKRRKKRDILKGVNVHD
jgi:polar amino acid transport system substrate-binding protein